MPEGRCGVCGGPVESGFVTTTNGSGLFWAKEAAPTRLRPVGLEVLVGTRFEGTSSANLPGVRCSNCRTILLSLSSKK